MKRLAALLLLALAFCSTNLFALQLTLQGGNGYGIWQYGIGGEFTFHISDPSLLTGYAGYAINQVGPNTSFQTFCVEGAENIYAYQTYNAALNNHSVYSNVQLTKGAAYLYSQFATGGNFGTATFSYANDHLNNANLLQRAIWMFMCNQEGLNMGNIGNNFFVNAAIAYFHNSFDEANSDAVTGFDNVYVLNLTDANGRAAQDQLIYSSAVNPNTIAPDGGVTAILLGMGLTAVGFVSRKIRK